MPPQTPQWTIAADWERSEDDQTWQRDFDIRYTKARSA